MTWKVRFARFGFVLALCVGLAFSLGWVRPAYASECRGFGAACETLCPNGYSQLDNYCIDYDGLWVDSINCNACDFPGGMGGLCNDHTSVGAYCF